VRENYPDDPYREGGGTNFRQASWKAIRPAALLHTLDHPTYPPVRSGSDLLRCIQIALDRLETSYREGEAVVEVWNKTTHTGVALWSPREETDISTVLKLFLERELEQFKPVISREPEARLALGGASSNNLDLLVTVPVDNQANAEVIVEVKGTWNDDLLTDLREQLVERYLANHTAKHGLYLAFHFGCTSWNQLGDGRKKRSLANKDIEEVRARLETERAKLPDIGKAVVVRVADVRIGL
jgi:hypothetical protein